MQDSTRLESGSFVGKTYSVAKVAVLYVLMCFYNNTSYFLRYRIAGNFGGGKFWLIWRIYFKIFSTKFLYFWEVPWRIHE